MNNITSTAVPCHITETEKEALKTVARDLQYKSVSELVRSCIFGSVGEQIKAVEQANIERRNQAQLR